MTSPTPKEKPWWQRAAITATIAGGGGLLALVMFQPEPVAYPNRQQAEAALAAQSEAETVALDDYYQACETYHTVETALDLGDQYQLLTEPSDDAEEAALLMAVRARNTDAAQAALDLATGIVDDRDNALAPLLQAMRDACGANWVDAGGTPVVIVPPHGVLDPEPSPSVG